MTATFANPIIQTDVPDPSVIRVGDSFYMTSTTMYFTPGCPVMKSKDLVNWEIIGYVYDTLSDDDCMTLSNGKHDYGKGSWASSLRYHNGMFYVTFVAYNTNSTYIFQTDDIEKGPWQKYILEGIYHDMSLLFDDGRVYMVYGGGAIKVIELTPDVTAIKAGGLNKTIIPHADPTGGNALAEGAHIYKIDSKYYIFIIAWPRTGTGRRIEVCYRADKIDGPYECKVVLDDHMGFMNAGVAQGGIVDTPDGQWFALLFQDHGAVGRIPVLVPVKWEDGWPVFGVDGRVPTEMPYTLKPCPTDGLVISDDFNAPNLPLQWQWNHNPVHSHWSLTQRPGYLRLITSHITDSIIFARNTLTQRTMGPTCSGIIFMDTARMQEGDVAGLAALQDKYGYVGVKMENGQRYIVMATAPEMQGRAEPPSVGFAFGTGQPDAAEMARVPLDQDGVYLRIDFDFANANDEACFYYSLCGENWVKIGTVLKMVYSLKHFTGYRYALFNYATQAVGGYVDFDWFKHICPIP